MALAQPLPNDLQAWLDQQERDILIRALKNRLQSHRHGGAPGHQPAPDPLPDCTPEHRRAQRPGFSRRDRLRWPVCNPYGKDGIAARCAYRRQLRPPPLGPCRWWTWSSCIPSACRPGNTALALCSSCSPMPWTGMPIPTTSKSKACKCLRIFLLSATVGSGNLSTATSAPGTLASLLSQPGQLQRRLHRH